MPGIDKHDLEAAWWVREPAPKPAEGNKYIIRKREALAMFEDRRYRVREGSRVVGPQTLRLHIWLWMSRSRHYDDTVELYSAEERQGFIDAAAAECKLDPSLIEKDLGVIVRYAEEARDGWLKDLAERREDGQPTLQ